MYTSAIKVRTASDPDKKTVRVYLLASFFVFIFGQIYERYSYGVYARGMFWAFLIPLLGGAALFGAIRLGAAWLPRLRRAATGAGAVMYHCGIATLTVGSLFKGALDIYGTTNSLISVYWVAGALLIAAGAAVTLARLAGVRVISDYN